MLMCIFECAVRRVRQGAAGASAHLAPPTARGPAFALQAIFGNTAHHSATAVHSARSEDASVAVPTPSPVQPATVGSTAEDEAKGVAVAGGAQRPSHSASLCLCPLLCLCIRTVLCRAAILSLLLLTRLCLAPLGLSMLGAICAHPHAVSCRRRANRQEETKVAGKAPGKTCACRPVAAPAAAHAGRPIRCPAASLFHCPPAPPRPQPQPPLTQHTHTHTHTTRVGATSFTCSVCIARCRRCEGSGRCGW